MPIATIRGASSAKIHADSRSVAARRSIMADIVALSVDSGFWSSVDRWALAIVGIGVVLEGIAEWLPPERREARSIVALTRTGWLILVLALAGEWYAQHRKDADDALIIAKLASEGDEARKQAAKIENDNLDLQKQVSVAQKDAADARAQEEQTREAIRRSVVWRALDAQDCEKVTKALNGERHTVLIKRLAGDPEAFFFALSIGICLHNSAGWDASFQSVTLETEFPLGMRITGKTAAAVELLAGALTKIGINSRGRLPTEVDCGGCSTPPPTSDPDVTLFVNSRPYVTKQPYGMIPPQVIRLPLSIPGFPNWIVMPQ